MIIKYIPPDYWHQTLEVAQIHDKIVKFDKDSRKTLYAGSWETGFDGYVHRNRSTPYSGTGGNENHTKTYFFDFKLLESLKTSSQEFEYTYTGRMSDSVV